MQYEGGRTGFEADRSNTQRVHIEKIGWNQYINKTIKYPKYGSGLIIDILDKEKK